jgi:hypothetical protein
MVAPIRMFGVQRTNSCAPCSYQQSPLEKFIADLPECSSCGRSDADRDPVVLAAIKVILDFGLKNSAATEPIPASFDTLSPVETYERLLALRARLDQLIIDAERSINHEPRLALPAVIDADAIDADAHRNREDTE